MNMWISYIWTAELRNKRKEDHRSWGRSLCNCEKKAWKNSGLPAECLRNGISCVLNWDDLLYIYFSSILLGFPAVSPKKNKREIHEEQVGLDPAEIRVKLHFRMPSWQVQRQEVVTVVQSLRSGAGY